MIAVMLPVMLGFAALVVDVGHAFVVKRHLQKAADAAALAAASALPNTTNATSVAYAYSASVTGGVPGHNVNSGLPPVTTDVSFPAPTGSKVKVVQSARSGVFFGALIPSFDGFDVSAYAVASRQSTSSGTPLAVFVHELCGNKGFISGGRNMRIEGGIHVNGNVEIKNELFRSTGAMTIYRPPTQGTSPPGPPQPSCAGKTYDQADSRYCTGCGTPPGSAQVDAPAHGAYRDWITPYHTQDIVKAAVPCTQPKTDNWVFSNSDPDGVYCLPSDKKFTLPAGTCTTRLCKLTVIAGTIEVGGRGRLEPYNSAAAPVLFYSNNSANVDAIKLNPSESYDWSGYIINRKGGIVINAAGVTSPQDGVLEAEWVEINGENFTMLGTAPDSTSGTTFGGVVLEE